MKIISKFISAVLVTGLVLIMLPGCNTSPSAVDRIELYPVNNPQVVPTGGSLSQPQKNPTPATVWNFSAGVKVYVGLRISKDLKEDVTFTRFTIANPTTSVEYEVGLPKELGPYKPGQTVILNFGDPWALPTEKTMYQFRVYVGDRTESIALFSVTD
jgi:hypothetical protein